MTRKIRKYITWKDYTRVHMEYKRENMNTKYFCEFNRGMILWRYIDEEEIFTYSDYHYIRTLQRKNKSIMK